MPKAAAPNAFFMFMLDTRRRLESRGERFPRGNEDVVGIAAEMWKDMPQEQKEAYKAKAKDYKQSQEFAEKKKIKKGQLPKEKRDAGAARRRQMQKPLEEDEFVEPMSYFYPSDDDEARDEFEKKRERDRSEIMDAWHWNMPDDKGLEDQKLYIISFLHHGHTMGYSYYPSEVGLVEFTMNKGFIGEYWSMLGPHEIQANMIGSAEVSSARTKIPYRDDGQLPPCMTNNYNLVMDQILRLIRPSKNLRRIWCLAKEFNTVQGCIKFLQMKSKMSEIRLDRINCVEDLLQLICDWKDKVSTGRERSAFADCDGSVPTGPFYENPEVLCPYHKNLGVHYCALGTAKRAMYFMLQRVQVHYGIVGTDKHQAPKYNSALAPDAAGSAAQIVQIPPSLDWYIPRPTVRPSQHLEDDASSTVTMTARRPRRMGPANDDDIGMPDTLPLDLVVATGSALPPDSWRQPNNESSNASGARPKSTFPSSTRGTTDHGSDVAQTSAPVAWDQNKSLRDKVYNKPRQEFGRDGRMERNQGTAQNAPPSGFEGVLTDRPQASSIGGMSSQRAGMMAGQPMIRAGNGVNLGLHSADFVAPVPQQQPLAFPPPQNVAPTVPPGFTAPRQRSCMAPRISMPVVQSNINANGAIATRPPTRFPANPTPQHQQPIRVGGPVSATGINDLGVAAAVANRQQPTAVVAPSVNSAVPKTTSRVKQIVMQRLQAQGKLPTQE